MSNVLHGDVLAGKVGIIFGVTNKDSIGFGAAQVMREAGIKVICTTVPALVSRAQEALGEEFDVLPLDVAAGESAIEELAELVHERYGTIDYVVHSMAFSDGEELTGTMVGKPKKLIPNFDTLGPKARKKLMGVSRENVQNAIVISAHSYLELARHFHPIMNPGGGFVAYSFAGSQFYSPFYNVMGPVKAALEAYNRGIAAEMGEYGLNANIILSGPIRTMSTARIGNFLNSLFMFLMRSAFRRPMTQREVGEATLNVLQSRAITGEAINVDHGVARLVGMGSTPNEVALNNEKRLALLAEAKAAGQETDDA